MVTANRHAATIPVRGVGPSSEPLTAGMRQTVLVVVGREEIAVCPLYDDKLALAPLA